MKIEELRPYQDQTVTANLHDGEVAVVKIVFVDLEYQDVIVDVLESNRTYSGPANAVYTIRAADIASVDPVKN